MRAAQFRQFVEANAYAQHVAESVHGDMIPRPPETPAELLVITEEYPHLLSAYLPLLRADTPTGRAADELIADVSDWL